MSLSLNELARQTDLGSTRRDVLFKIAREQCENVVGGIRIRKKVGFTSNGKERLVFDRLDHFVIEERNLPTIQTQPNIQGSTNEETRCTHRPA
jgi:hypothetical protein